MTIAEKVPRAKQDLIDVSNAGFEAGFIEGEFAGIEIGWDNGYESGKEEGIEEGKQAEYDRFMDEFQGNGERVNYDYAFSRWTDKILYPKYSMTPATASSMFVGCSAQIDLVERLKECGVTLDFSQATNHNGIFQTAKFTRVGVVDLTNATNNSAYIFNTSQRLETIDEVILSPLTTLKYTDMFSWCSRLKNLKISGGNFNYSVSFQWSPLTLESAISVITHIANFYDNESSQYTQTITFSAATWALLDAQTEEEVNEYLNSMNLSNYGSWREYISDELCWNYV